MTRADGSREAGRIAHDRVAAAGLDVLGASTLSPAGAAVSVVKTIAPGLEVETMSYGRIGERNTHASSSRAATLSSSSGRRAKPSGRYACRPRRSTRFGGQPLLDIALLDRIVGPLYPLYREPEAHHVAAALEQAAS